MPKKIAKTKLPPDLERLEQEMAANYLLGPRWRRNGRRPLLLEEMWHAIRPRVHEQRVAGYGSLVMPTREVVQGSYLHVPESTGHRYRSMADGRSSFIVQHVDRTELLCLDVPYGSELDLVLLADASGGYVVQRSTEGVVKVFGEEQVLIQQHRTWRKKPYARAAVTSVRQSVPQLSSEYLEALLSFCSHLLGDRHIGATFVYSLAPFPGVPREGAPLGSYGLSITDRSHHGAIANFLDTIDGAVLLDAQLGLLHGEIHLKNSDNARGLIKQRNGFGTRHLSAARYSFDHPEVIVITVSQDGPISVFSDGANVARLEERSASRQFDMLSQSVPEKRDHMQLEQREVVCSRCTKTSLVDIFTVDGYREQEEIGCPVCSFPLYSCACFELSARVLKSLPWLK
jgi:DNA integrity scanning protein DisA with diadenylate cyclase activity